MLFENIKTVFAIWLIIRNVHWMGIEQHIRMISEGSCAITGINYIFLNVLK